VVEQQPSKLHRAETSSADVGAVVQIALEGFVPKAYIVTTYRLIGDPDAVVAYGKLAGPAIRAAGGRFLVRGAPARTFEAGLDLRTVVIEFDSVASAIAAYSSSAYGEAMRLLGDAVVRDVRIVEGTG
jgi:uncharacterized protein (DUF1330 family)